MADQGNGERRIVEDVAPGQAPRHMYSGADYLRLNSEGYAQAQNQQSAPECPHHGSHRYSIVGEPYVTGVSGGGRRSRAALLCECGKAHYAAWVFSDFVKLDPQPASGMDPQQPAEFR